MAVRGIGVRFTPPLEKEITLDEVGKCLFTSKNNSASTTNELNFTLLEAEQILEKKKLKILKKYGVTASITDFAILLGGYVSDNNKTGGNDLEHRNGWYWSKNPYENNACVVSSEGSYYRSDVNWRTIGCRPVLPFSFIQEISLKVKKVKDDIIEYGEYPQKACCKELQNILEQEYKNSSLKGTGKSYTVDSRKGNEYANDFLGKVYEEYEYKGKKYIRVIANTAFGDIVTLSNGGQYKDGDFVWVEVSPVKWLIDKKTKIMVAKHILFAGIQFNNEQNYQGDFDNTNLGKYLKNVFTKDIIPSMLAGCKKQELTEMKKQTLVEKTVEVIKHELDKIRNYEDIFSGFTIEVNTILDDYNIKAKQINDNSDKMLLLGSETIQGIRNNCFLKLGSVLERVKKIVEPIAKYQRLLEYIDELTKIINNQEVELDTELKRDFKLINNQIIPFLDDVSQIIFKIRLTEILCSHKIKINNYIKNIIENQEFIAKKDLYTGEQNFELKIRNDIHPLLIELNDSVIKCDIAKQIIDGTNAIIKNMYQKDKASIINFYINIMNDLYQEITNNYNLSKQEKNELLAIIQTNVDTNKDINDILKQLTNIVVRLNYFNFLQQEKKKQDESRENSYIKARL